MELINSSLIKEISFHNDLTAKGQNLIRSVQLVEGEGENGDPHYDSSAEHLLINWGVSTTERGQIM